MSDPREYPLESVPAHGQAGAPTSLYDAFEDTESGTTFTNPPPDVLFPDASVGAYGYRPREERYGVRVVVKAIQEVSHIFSLRHPNHAIGVGDISMKGGGSKGHNSHQTGFDVDLRPLTRSGQRKPMVWSDPDYARELTQEVVDLLYANSHLRVELVLFNDPRVEGVKPWDGHDNHLHIRFYEDLSKPPQPTLMLNQRHPAATEMKRRLNAWAFRANKTPLPLSPEFDGATDALVRTFQTEEKLGADGKVGGETWGALHRFAFTSSAPLTTRQRGNNQLTASADQRRSTWFSGNKI